MRNKFPHEDLLVWQEAIKLTKEIYRCTNDFPGSELYGLTNQIRRAAVSISLNIAEGKGRYSKKEYIHFIYLARGSTLEVATCLNIANELSFIKQGQYDGLIEQTHKIQCQLNNLIKYLQPLTIDRRPLTTKLTSKNNAQN
jgi:four helix bundle protein